MSAYAHGDPTDHDKHILIGHKKYCQWDPSAVPVPITSTPCVEITDLDPSFAPLDTVFFHIEMKNIDPFPVDLTIMEEFYPNAFVKLGVDCNIPYTESGNIFTFSSTLAPNQSLICVIYGYFNGANSDGVNEVRATSLYGTETITGRGKAEHDYNPSLKITDVKVEKTATLLTDTIFSDPGPLDDIDVRYQITVSNNGNKPLLLGKHLRLTDRIFRNNAYPLNISASLNSPVTCTASPGTDCLDVAGFGGSGSYANIPGSSSSTILKRWRYPSAGPGMDGLLPVGGSFTLEFDVRYKTDISCVKSQSSVSPGETWGQFTRTITNQAFIDFNLTPGLSISDSNGLNNTSNHSFDLESGLQDTSDCEIEYDFVFVPPKTPNVTFSKNELSPITTGAPLAWGSPITYEITIGNVYPIGTPAADKLPMTNVSLSDVVSLNTAPPFIANFVSMVCVSGPCPTGISSGPSTVISNAQMWNASNFTIPADDTLTFHLTMTYQEKPDSCSTVDHDIWRMKNTAALNFTFDGVVYKRDAHAFSEIPEPDLCQFDVTKTWQGGIAPDRLEFGTPYQFDLSVTNNFNAPKTIHMMVDNLRVTSSAYGTVPYKYRYNCSGPGVSGYAPAQNTNAPNFNAPGSVGTATTDFNGPDIFGDLASPGGVTFQPGATLTCGVEILIERPANNTAGCQSDGMAALRNTFYINEDRNVNTSQPSAIPAVNRASVQAPLPRCYEFVVSKDVSTNETNSYGPGLTYTININSVGGATGPLSSPNTFILSDTFSGSYTASLVSVSAGATFIPPTPGSNPFEIEFTELPAGITTVTYELDPYFPTEYIQNDVELTANGTLLTEWFTKNKGQLFDYEDVEINPVSATSQICVEKYNDLNGNGARDLGESPLSGVSFIIRDSAGNVIVPTAITDNDGRFCTEKVLAIGDYQVEEVLQDGWTNTSPGNFPPIIDVSLIEISQIDTAEFGNMEIPGALKLCKTVDERIPAGTEFEFEIPGLKPTTVSAGSCKLITTNSPVGSQIKIIEPKENGYILGNILVEPEASEFSTDLETRHTIVELIAGTTEVSFQNEYRPAFIEICKNSDAQGMFTFEISPAPSEIISVPANSCSAPIEIPAGIVKISEHASSPFYGITHLDNVTAFPPNLALGFDLTSRTITLDIPPGTIGTQTIVTFGNALNEDRPQ